MPTYQPKHRLFVGLVFFEAEDAKLLPWNTTKRKLNKESSVYLRVRNKMISAARPIITFINERYSSDSDDTQEDKDIALKIEKVSVAAATKGGTSQFTAPRSKKKTTVKVQYDAEKEQIETIKKHLRKPSISASAIGTLTFNYYVEQEGLN